MRFKTANERQAKRARREITWCDCCQDAPATHRSWSCPTCGFTAIAPLEVALADPDFETCLNCDHVDLDEDDPDYWADGFEAQP
jgi:hypothetical protein